jgi:hypothetical protein
MRSRLSRLRPWLALARAALALAVLLPPAGTAATSFVLVQLGVAADQQLAAGLLVVIPGIFCVPVVYFALITWLRDSSYPDDELRRPPALSGLPKPPRGWRAPPPRA